MKLNQDKNDEWKKKRGKNQFFKTEEINEPILLYDFTLINDGLDLFLMFCYSNNFINSEFSILFAF